VHDYLTQRGGAERVVLSMLRAFPDAPLYTSIFEPSTTFPEFDDADVRPMPLSAVGALRRNHRLALPLLAPAFSRLHVAADVTICSSSGWAHGTHVTGRKLVYCHAPARWLYQPARYLRDRGAVARASTTLLRPALLRWDRRAARSADRYIVNSTSVRDAVRAAYGISSDVMPPPPALSPSGREVAVERLEPGFLLCVARLLPYKNVDVVIDAVRSLTDARLVVVGTGPSARRLRAAAPSSVRFLDSVPDEQMRWLYRTAEALVAVSYEDYGLTPLEAASFGTPTVALRAGGYLDTVVEHKTGVFVDEPTSASLAAGIGKARAHTWDPERIAAHAEAFSEERFIQGLRRLVDEFPAR
jgi:glycosyltransferase involved in cell wall biosynthesis